MSKDSIGIFRQTPEEFSLELKKDTGVLLFKPPRYSCPIHGEHDAYMNINIYDNSYIYCMKCYVEKLDDLGVSSMEEIVEDE